MQKKEEVDLSHKKKKKSKKNLYYGWERVIYTGKSLSVGKKGDEVKTRSHWRLGLSVAGPFADRTMNIYRLSIEFF